VEGQGEGRDGEGDVGAEGGGVTVAAFGGCGRDDRGDFGVEG
jgi:hypothetical protein